MPTKVLLLGQESLCSPTLVDLLIFHVSDLKWPTTPSTRCRTEIIILVLQLTDFSQVTVQGSFIPQMAGPCLAASQPMPLTVCLHIEMSG